MDPTQVGGQICDQCIQVLLWIEGYKGKKDVRI